MATTADLMRYGLKEVADLKIYEAGTGTIQENCTVSGGTEVATLDSLKVTSIEMTAEQTEAKGGKGNSPLVIWDYGKEITMNVEDALISAENLKLLFGVDGTDPDQFVAEGNFNKFVISPQTFPGTYTVAGTSYFRSEVDGKDHLFNFVIPKAKLVPENTFTMEAEGDPSVFNFNMKVLRDSDGDMIKMYVADAPIA